MIRKYLTKVPGLAMCLPLIIGGAFLGHADSASAQDRPQCSSAQTDPDGDGWGFENGQSCLVAAARSANVTVQAGRPVCTGAAINNGDGWGWENNQPCVYASGTGAQAAADSSGSRPVCTSAAIDNGDGWGWENNQPCIYSTPTASDDAPVSAVNSDGPPQCSARAVDNGNGWGFEFGASCIWGDAQPGSDIEQRDRQTYLFN